MSRTVLRPAHVALALVVLAACEDGTGPAAAPQLAFGQQSLSLGLEREASIMVRNTGALAVGPVEIAAGPVRRAGLDIPGAAVSSTPGEIPTLNPGDSIVVELLVSGVDQLQPGIYESELVARVQGENLATAGVAFQVPVAGDLVGSVEIVGAPATWRQGDVLELEVVVYDTTGVALEGAAVALSTLPAGRGLFTAEAEFVPYDTGAVSIVASSGTTADTVALTVEARGLSGSFSIVGSTSLTTRFTSDLWLFGDVAYTGTWSVRQQAGNTVYVWDVSGAPVLTDSVQVQAGTINDVKIRADGELAVLTHERVVTSHALTILDMTDPQHPVVAGELLSDITSGWIGTHNLWIEGDYVYLVVDGSASNRGLWIIDISDPANPERVAQYHGGSSFLHDVYVRDGLAFLSHWDAGLIILDVGNGIRGGSPTSPVEVSRVQTAGGQTHNAWYWPETGYVFVGEEDFVMPGYMHVVDASDLLNPVEVASYRVPGDAPHNFWLDEARGILYMAWYSRGLHALDVSGRLIGDLAAQGRRIAEVQYDGVNDCWGESGTCTWAPQLQGGFVYVSDMNSGLWKLQPNF